MISVSKGEGKPDNQKGKKDMMKVTQKELKDMAGTYYAEDITKYSVKECERLYDEEGYFDTIAYSHGIYRCNGKLLRGYTTRKLYVIASRTQAINMF